MSNTDLLQVALKQIAFARGYTLTLLDDIDEADWFAMPGDCVTHTAWQVGHLAMAQYGLALFRQRGRQPEDTDLMSSKFRKQFSRGATPDSNPGNNPTPAEIRAVFDRVHQQVLREVPGYSNDDLDTPIPEPHAVFDTKLGALFFCANHEMLHAGQIGLIRRMLGKATIR